MYLGYENNAGRPMKRIWVGCTFGMKQCRSAYGKTLGRLYLGYENNEGQPMKRLSVGSTLVMKTCGST